MANHVQHGSAGLAARSGFMAWFLQPSVLGFGGLALLALGIGSAVLLIKAPSPPDLAQLTRHDGVVEAVLPRKVQQLEHGRYQTRRDGWILRLEGGSEFFLGTPDAFDDAGDLSYARTEAALPAGTRVTLLADGPWAWDLSCGASKLIDYGERRDQKSRGTATTTLIALISLVVGGIMLGSGLKRFWNSSGEAE